MIKVSLQASSNFTFMTIEQDEKIGNEAVITTGASITMFPERTSRPSHGEEVFIHLLQQLRALVVE